MCGQGDGPGGGYSSPGQYRSKSQIRECFRRAGVAPHGQSSTRKWFTLEALQAINGTPQLGHVVTRLVSPKEYRGDAATSQLALDHVNQLLQIEGLEIQLVGIDPQVRERNASASTPKPKEPPIESSPDFASLVSDPSLAEILRFRPEEAQRCARGRAHLASIVMMGGMLEGILLHRLENDLQKANRAPAAPKDRFGAAKKIHEWSLSTLIDVAHELGWLQGDVKRFSPGPRESRNVVHPHVQRLSSESPDEDTCEICWQVVRAAVADLPPIDERTQRGGNA
jgi:hypothetical protein